MPTPTQQGVLDRLRYTLGSWEHERETARIRAVSSDNGNEVLIDCGIRTLRALIRQNLVIRMGLPDGSVRFIAYNPYTADEVPDENVSDRQLDVLRAIRDQGSICYTQHPGELVPYPTGQGGRIRCSVRTLQALLNRRLLSRWEWGNTLVYGLNERAALVLGWYDSFARIESPVFAPGSGITADNLGNIRAAVEGAIRTGQIVRAQDGEEFIVTDDVWLPEVKAKEPKPRKPRKRKPKKPDLPPLAERLAKRGETLDA